ncbi:MAG TPA: tyrosine-type recombinase/integrase [Terracidiphilus sp.]|nr:tyrosine-type recombinase/integrase [Terracidiphilus sp.]
MKAKRPRYQQGSIRKVSRAKGYAWEVRFSDWKNGKRHQRTLTFDAAEYPSKKEVRRAIELDVSQVNASTGAAKGDAKFMDVCALYRKEHLPTLEHSTRYTNSYLLDDYIEAHFGHTSIRDVKPLEIDRWIKSLNLAATTKASIRSVMSVCFNLAALYEYIPPMQRNPMSLIKLKGVSKRQKKIPEITFTQFKAILAKLPEPLSVMVLLAGAYGLRVSELLALKWEDIDAQRKTISIVRKFTRGKLGKTKTASSEAPLPLSDEILKVLVMWKPKTDNSEWLFPSPRTGGPRSASMLLQKGLKPVAKDLGIENIGFHTLRHACRSWLNSGGTDLGTQKDLLRHADISTTANIYGHALTEDMRKAHEQLVGKLLQ